MGFRFDRQRLVRLLNTIAPRMAGATVRERLVAALGTMLALGLTGVICGVAVGQEPGLPLLVAPIGASAVLMFTVPSSPIAQPWAVIGGNSLSSLLAIAIIHVVPQPAMAGAIAVAAAMILMTLTRSLHPPGGALALLVALMGIDSPAGDYQFAVVPVALNSALLVLTAMVFHRLSGHTYPNIAKAAPAAPHGTRHAPPQVRHGPSEADIDTAVARSGEIYEIGMPDLARLIREVEQAAAERSNSFPACADVMSRDVVTIPSDAPPAAARDLLLSRNLRVLPVLEADGTVAGVVGLRHFETPGETVGDVTRPAVTAREDDSVLRLVDPLTDGRNHAALIVGEDGKLAGLITQTDLIAVMARLALAAQGGRSTTRA